MKGKLFQLNDSDNMPVGLFYSEDESIPNDVIEQAWNNWVSDETNWVNAEKDGIDGFKDYLFEHLGLNLERLFVEEIFIQ